MAPATAKVLTGEARMDVQKAFSGLARFISWAVVFLCTATLLGCAIPDLKPFADVSKTLNTAVSAGGDLAIKPLTRQPHWDGTKYILPNDPNHPSNALQKSWELRHRTMQAVLVYSASLAAIGEASANRKQNATELVGSVKQLVSAVPGLSLGSSAAGDLLVFGFQTIVEIKASNDMQQAVEAANPAIQLVAQALSKDFSALSHAFESRQLDQLIQKDIALRPVLRASEAIRAQFTAQRDKVANAPSDTTASSELMRLNNVIAAVDPDLNRLRAERIQIEERLQEGKAFFTSAINAVEGWASAHADLAKALEQNRSPNLVLLAARAEELKDLVDQLRK
jgi:hypothetical protein